jgi:hypothetical protein
LSLDPAGSRAYLQRLVWQRETQPACSGATAGTRDPVAAAPLSDIPEHIADNHVDGSGQDGRLISDSCFARVDAHGE